jgi:RNA recognition motif-containing protein
LFGQVGSIVDVIIPTDRLSGRPRGFAFIEFSSEAEAQAAIQRFDGHELDGRALRVNEASERPPRPPGFGPPPGRGGFGGDDRPFRPLKAKGSRRHLRARKRGG